MSYKDFNFGKSEFFLFSYRNIDGLYQFDAFQICDSENCV